MNEQMLNEQVLDVIEKNPKVKQLKESVERVSKKRDLSEMETQFVYQQSLLKLMSEDEQIKDEMSDIFYNYFNNQ